MPDVPIIEALPGERFAAMALQDQHVNERSLYDPSAKLSLR
jgi:hypothetical protein